MDGYVATFDSSIVGGDTAVVKPSANKQSSDMVCMSRHTGLSNDSVSSRLSSYQRGEGAYLNAQPCTAKASVSSDLATDCLQPSAVDAFSHRILNGKFVAMPYDC